MTIRSCKSLSSNLSELGHYQNCFARQYKLAAQASGSLEFTRSPVLMFRFSTAAERRHVIAKNGHPHPKMRTPKAPQTQLLPIPSVGVPFYSSTCCILAKCETGKRVGETINYCSRQGMCTPNRAMSKCCRIFSGRIWTMRWRISEQIGVGWDLLPEQHTNLDETDLLVPIDQNTVVTNPHETIW